MEILEMNAFWDRYHDLSPFARIAIIGAFVLVLASCGLFSLVNMRSGEASLRKTQTASSTASPSRGATDLPVSRFIFGTNLSPYDKHYQIVTSPSTRNLLQQMHIQMVRIPLKNQSSEADITQAAQGIKKLNAVPLVSLYDPFYPGSEEENSKIITIMNKVFGQANVYYEYGSEDDAIGITAEEYTAAWNKNIPALKQLAPAAHFVGPATYHYTTQYLQTFLKQANPLPDEISWHEYACDAAESQAICMQRLNNWSNDIIDARATTTQIVGKPLPIIISEWNYAANAKANDGKSNDPTFLAAWTAQALQVLSDNQIFASMQYFCTGVTPLISNNEITPEGEVLMGQYERFVTSRMQATPTLTATSAAQTTATASPTATATAQATASPTATAQTTEAASPTPTDTPTPGITPTPTDTPTVGITPTSTPTPVATATSVSAPHITAKMTPSQIYQTATSGPLLYNAALVNQDSASWSEMGFSGGGGCSFAGGSGYQVTMPQRNRFASCMEQGMSYNNFTLQVEMEVTAGSDKDGGGVIFRAGNNGGYRFRVGADGSYDLVDQQQSLASGTNAVISPGLAQSNMLTVVVEGSDIYLFVNQIYLTHVSDSSFTGGQIGLMAVDWSGNNTTVVFKNMTVWQLS
jgi:hypothetical protein